MESSRRELETTIQVNGRPRAVNAGNLGDLLVELGYDLDQQGIAVAVNDEVVLRRRWSVHAVRSGDRVEIVGAVQGG